jgi:NAD(P)-dependent dehydrogenase (short-subunit alcohol dehydrogenase family)
MTAKTVLVTGAASGIGKATATALAAQGYLVFAGALNEAEAASITALGNASLVATQLDISSIDSIESAIAAISARLGADQPLGALVNIAGVNINAPLHILSVAEIKQMIDVNLLGTILLTRASLPLLLRGPGRVVLVGSATAFLPPPAISIYAATKCALSGLGDSLRMELGMAGLAVSVIEPGVVHTPLTAAGPVVLNKMLSRMGEHDRSLYEKLMRKIVQMSTSPKSGIPPETVAGVIAEVLMTAKPKPRYRVGIDSKAAALLSHLPAGAKDFIQRKTFGI